MEDIIRALLDVVRAQHSAAEGTDEAPFDMNEIETEVSGKVTQICVEDGQSVEYGQVLMYIE